MSDRGERNVGIRPWQWGGGSVSHCSSPRAHGDAKPPIHSVCSPTAAGPVLHAPRSAGPRSRQIPPTSRRGGKHRRSALHISSGGVPHFNISSPGPSLRSNRSRLRPSDRTVPANEGAFYACHAPRPQLAVWLASITPKGPRHNQTPAAPNKSKPKRRTKGSSGLQASKEVNHSIRNSLRS